MPNFRSNLVRNCHHKPAVVGGCHLQGDLQLRSHLEQVLLGLFLLLGPVDSVLLSLGRQELLQGGLYQLIVHGVLG